MITNLFDANYYRAANLDLRDFNDTQTLSHFQNYGLNEGRSFSAFVNLNFYRASNPDLADLGFNNHQLLAHLQNYGVAEGRSFSSLVDLNFYRANNSDLTSFDNEQLFEHLRNWGVMEERRFSPFVDLNVYRVTNPDLRVIKFDNKQLFEHLANYGVAEGRQFSVSFDSNYYRLANYDLAALGLNNSQLFDHFQRYGLNEGRASSDLFNVSYYLNNNFDLKALGFNYQQAQQHFELFGFREGRVGAPSNLITYTTELNDTLGTAFNIGIFNGSRNITNQFVGSADRDDYYRFTLCNLSNFNLVLNDMGADTGVELLDSNGSLIMRSNNSSSTSKSISCTLEANTYYIQVYSYNDADIHYNLSFFATPVVSNDFNSVYGYGLANAAAAVAHAIGQINSFPDIPNLSGNDWGLDMVNAPEVWAQGYSGQDVVVAVVDSGVDYNHSDLDANIWRNSGEIADNGIDDDGNGYIDDIRGWDFVDRDNTPMDLNGHGTHVSGTIAAENNSFGTTGVAYNARIMPVRVVNGSGRGASANMAAGIRYAADNGANIINLSLASRVNSSDMELAIRYATERGSVVVMAAGNQGDTQPAYPALDAKEWGIAVGAVDSNSQIASFSNLAGSTLLDYVVAPGVNVYSTYLNNTYTSLNGTSMASPYVTGVVALMLSANPNLTPDQVESYLAATANPIGVE